ncbi:MAG: ribbon-helix-helix protein, CopG family [Phycisphaerales bacterium]
MPKKKVRKKERIKWRRITVSVSDDLYELLEERAAIAGVSMSRMVFSLLKRKKVVIVPGFGEFVRDVQQICRYLNTTHNDPQLLREVATSLNRNSEFFEAATSGVIYPRLIETGSEKYEAVMPPNRFFKNLVEV